jgi:uncharacterized protein DUF4198
MRSTDVRRRLGLLLLILPFLGVRAGEAHDFWIAPSPLGPQLGQGVLVRLFAGEWFEGDEIPYRSAHAVRFEYLTTRGKREPLAGREGSSPAAILRPNSPGLYLIAYTSAGTDIVLDASKFNAYLKDQGLDAVLEARQKNGQDQMPGKERFFRYAKALVVTMGAQSDTTTGAEVLGQKLEIVPEFDPVRVANLRGPIRVRVLFEGKPLAGARVLAMPESDPQTGLLQGTTDRSGRVSFALDRDGVWMVKLVHMVPGRRGADWESSWGSLVFQAG